MIFRGHRDNFPVSRWATPPLDPNQFEGIYNNDVDGSAKRDQIVDMLSQVD